MTSKIIARHGKVLALETVLSDGNRHHSMWEAWR